MYRPISARYEAGYRALALITLKKASLSVESALRAASVWGVTVRGAGGWPDLRLARKSVEMKGRPRMAL
jgi:hypothetical protein